MSKSKSRHIKTARKHTIKRIKFSRKLRAHAGKCNINLNRMDRLIPYCIYTHKPLLVSNNGSKVSPKLSEMDRILEIFNSVFNENHEFMGDYLSTIITPFYISNADFI